MKNTKIMCAVMLDTKVCSSDSLVPTSPRCLSTILQDLVMRCRSGALPNLAEQRCGTALLLHTPPPPPLPLQQHSICKGGLAKTSFAKCMKVLTFCNSVQIAQTVQITNCQRSDRSEAPQSQATGIQSGISRRAQSNALPWRICRHLQNPLSQIAHCLHDFMQPPSLPTSYGLNDAWFKQK